jgi:alginate O-acetyltransferase complex protein AlgI
MFFQSLEFIAFFTLVCLVYWKLQDHRKRMGWLLLASITFYMRWHPVLILLILFSASVDYIVALKLAAVSHPLKRRALLLFSIGTNLGLLLFFKYTDFLLAQSRTVLGWFGIECSPPALNLVLPLGISFYTFETISYIVDVYQGKQKPVRSVLDYALYIMFFPHLLAGPIVRPSEFLPQLGRTKRFSWDRFHLGVQYFLRGLFKKAVLADHLGAVVVDPVFASPGQFGTAAVWLASLAYAGQIYCDFGGYSDMAIGLAHGLGFKLPRNFNLPYLAANISEFWHRWHISLSRWLRDYLFIPLGGSRGGKLATFRNLMLTMLLGGFWHGANWNFAAWGLYHGVLLVLQRAIPFQLSGSLGRVVSRLLTFLAVLVGWVFFRARSFADIQCLLTRLFWPTEGWSLSLFQTLLAGTCIAAVVLGHVLDEWIPWRRIERRLPAPVLGGALALLLLVVQGLMPATSKLFIYFRF